MTYRLIPTIALLAGLTATGAAADTLRFSIGGGHPTSAAWVATIRDFFQTEVTRRVKETTGDDVTWVEGYGGSVCKLDECLETVEAGLLDMAMLGTAFEPSKLQAHNFSYFVPFGSPDPVVVAAASRKVYDEVPELAGILKDRYNQVFLGVSVVGNYGLTTTFDWRKVDDLSGRKIAAAGPNLPWLEGTGVVPVPSNLNEAYTSLQTGVYNGWIMYPDAMDSFRLYEVSPHFADLAFGAISFPILTMNADSYADLAEPVQQILVEVAREWSEVNALKIREMTAKAFEVMQAANTTIIPVDDALRADFAARMPNLPKQRHDELVAAGDPGQAIYVYIDALKELGHVFPRDWAAEK